MKLYYKPYLILLLLACSCQFTRETEAPEPGKTILFHAGAIPTKTHFGDPSEGVYPSLWSSEGDKVAIALNYSEPVEATVTASSDGRSADFVADVNYSSAPYVFRAFSPASAVKSLSPSRKAWSISIPSVQTPLPGSPDEAAQLISAVSVSFPTLPDEVSLSFSHVTAYGRLSFKNLELGGAVVSKVELTATVPLCGEWYYDGSALSPAGTSSTLTIVTSATEDIWFASAPAALGSERLSVRIYTDKGSMVKEILVPDGYNLKSGKIAKIGIDMSGIGFEGGESYTLVTDASTLAVGDKIVIVYETGSVTMAAQKETYREGVGVSISNHSIAELPSEAAVLTLEAGSSSGQWALKATDGYLAASSSTKNQLVTTSTKNSNSSWSIEVDSDGSATVKAKGSYTRNWLLYNSTSPRFACYAGTSSNVKLIQIYRKGAPGVSVEEDPITQMDQYGLYLDSHQRVYNPGSDQYSRAYDGTLCFTILDPTTREQLEISGYDPSMLKGDKLTVKVLWRRGYVSIMNASYEMTVVKEDGPKVWLGDGTGRGFIIKK